MKFSLTSTLIFALLNANNAAAFVPSSTNSFISKTSSPNTVVPQVSFAAAPKALRLAKKKKKKAAVATLEKETTEEAPKKFTNPSITKDEVRSLFSLWNDALATGDSKIVAS